MTKIDVEDFSAPPRDTTVDQAERDRHGRAMTEAMKELGDTCVGVVLIGVLDEGHQSRACMGLGTRQGLSIEAQAKAQRVLANSLEQLLIELREDQS